MKAHELEAIGFLKLHYTPTEPNHAVRKQDLDAFAASTSSKPVFITDVVPLAEGNVGSKLYADTNPPNQIVTRCVTDTPSIRIHFLAESGVAFTSPVVEAFFNGQLLGTATEYTSVENGMNAFRGYIDVSLPSNGVVELTSSQGTSTSVGITVEAFGPVISTFSNVALPSGQTRVKQDDIVTVTGVVENTAVDIRVLEGGAASSKSIAELAENDSAGSGYKTFTCYVSVSGLTGLQTITARAVNLLGTEGAPVTSPHVRLDQSVPNVALVLGVPSNGSEYASLGATISASLTYTNTERSEFYFSHGDSGGSISALLPQRTLKVTEPVYSESGGIVVHAWQDANGTYAEFEFDVAIASLPMSLVSMTINGAVLRSSSRVIPSLPLFGESMAEELSDAIDDLVHELPSTDNQDFFIEAPAGYGYMAYPAALGAATFIDLSTGMVGGWTGHTVVREGVEWMVYKSDYPGLVTPILVEFQNPGLSVGSAESVPHVMSSPDGLLYTVALEFDQATRDAPSLVPGAGTWATQWERASATTWVRDLLVRNSDKRGATAFTQFSASSPSGDTLQEPGISLGYAVAGFEKRSVTFPALTRLAPIGVAVYNVTNTNAQYAGSDSDLLLRTDTRDVRSSYSVVDSEGNYASSMGTHLWLNDVDFAMANTSGTLQVDIEELP